MEMMASSWQPILQGNDDTNYNIQNIANTISQWKLTVMIKYPKTPSSPFTSMD